MCLPPTLRAALAGLGMVDGLAAEDVDHSLARYRRLDEIGRRGLAFYLLDVEERRLHQHFGHSHTAAYAQHRHGLSPRRVRELIATGRALRELPLVDEAFCAQEISWTQVLLLNRVVVPEHQAAWLEKARSLTTQALRREVLRSRRGEKPREPGDGKGTPEVRFPLRATLGTATYEMLNKAQQKLSAERGRAVTAAELLDVALGIYLDMERTGKAEGWTHVPSSLYRIVLRTEDGDDGDDALLHVETEDGLLPVDACDANEPVGRQRSACARCDGEVVVDSGDALDPPTPPALRRRVLARDGHRCRCCGERHSLHVHHIVWRSTGGRTKVHNLITLCVRCHALVHDGLLAIEGRTQRKARFVDRAGRPIHEKGRPADAATLLRIEAPPPRSVPRTAAVERPAQPDADPEAFAGIVGQDALVARLRVEAEGARALGEAFPHTLFTGSPGTGKTTLARALASFLGARFVSANGPGLRDVASLRQLLAGLGEGDVLFLDEVHAVPQGVLEALYLAMTESRPAFTLLAATTEPAELPPPLVTRFALREHLDLYEERDLEALARRAAEAKGVEIDEAAAALLARQARGTPRQLLTLLGRARRQAAGSGHRRVDGSLVRSLLGRIGIDEHGNGPTERLYLQALRSSRDPIPLVRLARLIGMDVGTLTHEIEPWLYRRGFIRITRRGRTPAPARLCVRRDDTPDFKPSAGRRSIAAVEHGM